MIKIGITSCLMYPDPGRLVFGPKSLNYLEEDMAQYVTQKGVLPVLIPRVAQPFLNDILAEMDGFVFQGGTDVAPETYNEAPIGQWRGDRPRDVYELEIMDYAVKHHKPIFAICRGMQLMNVYFGGSLYQDTLTQRPASSDHRSAEKYDTIAHPVHFTKGSFLEALYIDEAQPKINTVHHQAVKELGKDLEVLATSPDGLVEAIGYTKMPAGKVMGVQWHPEFTPTLSGEVIDHHRLFQVFLNHTKSEA